MRSRTGPGTTGLLAAGLVSLVAACGSEAEPESGGATATPSSTATAPTSPEEGAGQRPSANQSAGGQGERRVFSPQLPARRPDFDAVAAGVDPSHPSDPWPGELLAMSAERVLERAVRYLASGGAPGELRGLVTKDVSGDLPWAESGGPRFAGEDLLTELAGILRLDDHSPEDIVVQVDVVAVEAPEIGGASGPLTGTTTARVRVGTRPEARRDVQREQRDSTWEITWRLGRRASRMATIDVPVHSRASGGPPFRDVTDDVLVGERVDGALRLGALEAGGRTDRLSPISDVLTGMHGAAVGDLDGNGWEDLVVGRAAGQPNLVFMNEGGVLREDGAARGLDLLDDTGGALIVDLDGDGARDVALGLGDDVLIAWNDGTGRFPTTTLLDGHSARVYSLCAADVDGDGDLDLYDTRYFRSGGYGAQAPTPYHDATNGAANVFWRNRLRDGSDAAPRAFRDDTAAIGLDVDNDRFSLVGAFDDLDLDGDLDLYVANDFGRNNLYLWEGDRFRPAAETAGLVDKAAGMGISIADADLDGLVDVVVSNMFSAAGMRVTRDPRFQPSFGPEARAEFMRHARGNTLFRGVAPGRFEDVTDAAGAAPGGWAWGARFVDWDRDGLVDIVVPNGFLSGRKGPDLQSFFWRRVVGSSPLRADAPEPDLDRYLGAWSVISTLSQFERQDWNARERTFGYRNDGDLRFRDVSLQSGLGFADDGRALVTSDLDQDGRLDLVFRNRTAPILRVLQGTVDRGHWVSLRLAQDALDRDAIGALITVAAGGVDRRARVTAGDGFLGGSTLEAFFGLDERTAIDAIEVRWPDGARESFATEDAAGASVVDGAWTLRRGTGRPELRHRGRPSTPAFDVTRAPSRPSGEPGPPRSRVPLFDEFPLGAWRLPRFDGRPERVDALVGERGALVVLWADGVPGSRNALAAAASGAAALGDLGVHVHPIALDGVREADAAEASARATGLPDPGGRADRATRTLVDLVLGRTLAPFDDLPVPIGMLMDAEGDLACLYVGELDLMRIGEDAVALASRSDSNSTLALTGGRWISPPRRSFGDLPDKLASRGFDEFADHLRARSGPR